MKMESNNNNNLMPLPPSDFTPFYHSQLLLDSQPEFASFDFPLIHRESTTQLFDFFSRPSPLHTFQPPSLSLSLDHPPPTVVTDSSSSSTRKRRRSESAVHAVSPPAPGPVHRREKMSDKTQCLQKLMPFDKKMDIATMLEEAFKYVQFLQSQIRALSSMPLQSSFVVQNDICDWGGRFGCLGMLNRQQLLQVFVNSPVAQTMLYSQGSCVFSLEQLLLMNQLSPASLSPQ
ncbi:transcription factor bHLH [Melia azedarach]|uniref:Transcription factor bHLH n=1 Tax=Melia azedarach TaxID=155640 RepID=A0ACC1Z1W4_MELAZ|nr:transcription factor bHLH [Melia azedarach]